MIYVLLMLLVLNSVSYGLVINHSLCHTPLPICGLWARVADTSNIFGSNMLKDLRQNINKFTTIIINNLQKIHFYWFEQSLDTAEIIEYNKTKQAKIESVYFASILWLDFQNTSNPTLVLICHIGKFRYAHQGH